MGTVEIVLSVLVGLTIASAIALAILVNRLYRRLEEYTETLCALCFAEHKIMYDHLRKMRKRIHELSHRIEEPSYCVCSCTVVEEEPEEEPQKPKKKAK